MKFLHIEVVFWSFTYRQSFPFFRLARSILTELIKVWNTTLRSQLLLRFTDSGVSAWWRPWLCCLVFFKYTPYREQCLKIKVIIL